MQYNFFQYQEKQKKLGFFENSRRAKTGYPMAGTVGGDQQEHAEMSDTSSLLMKLECPVDSGDETS